MKRRDRDPKPAVSVPLAEESASVSKQKVATGKVRVVTRTEEVQQHVRERLESEAVEVTYVGINREVDSVPPVRTEGDVTIVSLVDEVLVVEKRLFLREEIHLRRRRTSEIAELTVPLRRQRADVERLEAGTDETPTISKDMP